MAYEEGVNMNMPVAPANGLHDMIDNLPEDKMMQVQRYIEEMGRM